VGFVHKSARPRELVELLLAAAAGEPAFDTSTASLLASSAVATAPRPTFGVSPLQRDLLRAWSYGLEGDALAEHVGIGSAEVDGAVRVLLSQIGAANAAAAVAWGLRNAVIV
jgi:DNA-binding NarL/FixJ family response regulator